MVDDIEYRWYFSPGKKKSLLKLQGSSPSKQTAVIELSEWRDFWLAGSGQEMQEPNAPLSVTPGFVADSISFALSNGWNPQNAGSVLLLKYSGGRFLNE